MLDTALRRRWVRDHQIKLRVCCGESAGLDLRYAGDKGFLLQVKILPSAGGCRGWKYFRDMAQADR